MISVLRLSVMTYRARAAAGAGSWTRTALLSTATAVVPTRPMPAYARFAKEQYADAVKTLAEDAPKTQAFKIIGASWQAMDEKERTKYTTAYDKDFVEYKKECAKYIAAGGDPESLILRHKIKKPRRDPTKPKRNVSAWTAFVRSYMVNRKDAKPVKEAMADAATAWKGMDDEAKKPFQLESDKAAAVYQKAMSKWEAEQEPTEQAPAKKAAPKKAAPKKAAPKKAAPKKAAPKKAAPKKAAPTKAAPKKAAPTKAAPKKAAPKKAAPTPEPAEAEEEDDVEVEIVYVTGSDTEDERV